MKDLNAEYAEILPRKKKNYQSYRAVRKENEEWQIAKSLVAAILQEETRQEEEQRRQQYISVCFTDAQPEPQVSVLRGLGKDSSTSETAL